MSAEEETPVMDFNAFSLMNFKVKYTKEETADVLKWIEEEYKGDVREELTWWLAEYKFDEHIKGNQSYMTSNLVAGWMRNIDNARKDAFCSACVLCDKDDEANQTIKMVWLIKGKELPKPLVEQELGFPLSDNCDFRTLDYDNADDRKILSDLLLWSDEIMGKKFLNGTLFK